VCARSQAGVAARTQLGAPCNDAGQGVKADQDAAAMHSCTTNSNHRHAPAILCRPLTVPALVKVAVLMPTRRPKESTSGPPLFPALMDASVCSSKKAWLVTCLHVGLRAGVLVK
jgi:hypothetical protein